MIKTHYYSFEILEKTGVAEIKRNGLFKTLRNHFLLEKEEKIIKSTDIFKKDFNGEFEKADVGDFNILYSSMEKRKKGIFSSKFFCEIIFKGSTDELRIFESWLFNKSQYIVIEQRHVSKARYDFTARKMFLTNEEDYDYLSCSYGVQLKKYIRSYFPDLTLNISIRVKKSTGYNEYIAKLVKDFWYKCIVEGAIHRILLFKKNFLNHRLSELLTRKDTIDFSVPDRDDKLEFL